MFGKVLTQAVAYMIQLCRNAWSRTYLTHAPNRKINMWLQTKPTAIAASLGKYRCTDMVFKFRAKIVHLVPEISREAAIDDPHGPQYSKVNGWQHFTGDKADTLFLMWNWHNVEYLAVISEHHIICKLVVSFDLLLLLLLLTYLFGWVLSMCWSSAQATVHLQEMIILQFKLARLQVKLGSTILIPGTLCQAMMTLDVVPWGGFDKNTCIEVVGQEVQ